MITTQCSFEELHLCFVLKFLSELLTSLYPGRSERYYPVKGEILWA